MGILSHRSLYANESLSIEVWLEKKTALLRNLPHRNVFNGLAKCCFQIFEDLTCPSLCFLIHGTSSLLYHIYCRYALERWKISVIHPLTPMHGRTKKQSCQNATWWISVPFLGIRINLFSELLKNYLGFARLKLPQISCSNIESVSWRFCTFPEQRKT